uniref:Uncharacterized protein n=1 Tax=Manihot esculenta TaxID=3983 RepID=A0A2C9UHB5_MANES
MHRQVYIGEERVWRKTDMEVAVPVLLKMVFCLFLLKALAARPHSSGQYQQMGRRGETGLELAPRWWSEDYSLPRRRRHVNNNLEH